MNATAPRYEGPYFLTDGKAEVRFALLGERASIIDPRGERVVARSEAREVWRELARLGWRRTSPKPSAPWRACTTSERWAGD